MSWWRNFWPAISWFVVILLLTALPGSYFPQVETFWEWLSPDKLVHVIMFGVFTALILFGARAQYFNPKTRYTVVIVSLSIGIVFGLITELLQYYVIVGRHGSLFDFIADGLGAFVGCLAFYLLFRKKINTKL